MMSTLLWKLEHVVQRGRWKPRLEIPGLEIHAGVTGVIGPSGAGKTSLLNLLSDFERPDTGRIVASIPQQNGRLPLYWVPQSDGLWPHLSVREHLQLVQPGQGDARLKSDRLLELADLDGVADARPERLSQGEKVRLSVARALATQAAVLIMDEPLAHLDVARTAAFRDVIRRYCEETESSLVIATHDPETVLSCAARVICLDDGRLVYDGGVEQLYYRPPAAELAEFLGPSNWFSKEEAAAWLTNPPSDAICCRPEQLSITACEESSLVVTGARFCGSVAELDLIDERSNRRRQFLHRPSRNRLQPGDRVSLTVLLAMLVCLLLPGCGPAATEAGPPLAVKSVKHWPMPPAGPKIPAPRGMTCGPDNTLYVVDNAGRVLVFDEAGKLLRQWNMPESAAGNPEGLCLFRDGRVAVADTHYSRIVFFDQQGEVTAMCGRYGTGPGEFIYPVAIAQDDDGNFYVGEYGSNDRVQKFSADGDYLLEFGTCGTGVGQFQRASGIVCHAGMIYVADAFNNRIQVFTESGEFVRVLGSADKGPLFEFPYDLSRGPGEDLFVVEYQAGRISRISLSGEVLGRFGSTGRGEFEFFTPWGLAVDARGRVFVADTNNRRIAELQL